MTLKQLIKLLWYNLKIKLGYQADTTSRKLVEFWQNQAESEAVISAYRQAIALNPQDETLLLDFASFLREQKRYSDAIPVYEKVIVMNNSLFLAHRDLGHIFRKQQRWQDAEIAYRQAIKLLDCHSPFLYRKLGTTLAQQQRWLEAITAYQLGWDKEQKICQDLLICKTDIEQGCDTWETYQYLFEVLGQAKQWAGAIAAWWNAFKANPKEGWWRDERALKLSKKYNKLEHLEACIRQEFENHPKDLDVGLNLSAILSYQNRFCEAKKIHKRISELRLKERYPSFSKETNVTSACPDFTIIGAHKSGTSSLYHYLDEHPQISLSIKKELHFWSLHYDKGRDWYLSHFLGIPNHELWVTGEASPTYLDSPETPERMYREFPNMKLIILLRNPVSRAISHYYHWVRLKKEFRPLDIAFAEQLADIPAWDDVIAIRNHYIARGCYVKFLKKWLHFFPREHLLVIPSEQFQDHPSDIVQMIHSFLKVPGKPLENLKYHNAGNYEFNNPILTSQLQNFYAPYNQELENVLEQSFPWTTASS